MKSTFAQSHIAVIMSLNKPLFTHSDPGRPAFRPVFGIGRPKCNDGRPE